MRFPKKLVVETYYLSYAYWYTYTINIAMVIFITSFNDSDHDILWTIVILVVVVPLIIFLMQRELKKFMDVLDQEDFEYFNGEDARGKSVYISHLPSTQ